MRVFLTALVAVTALTAPLARADKWCFVVTGDGRSDTKTARPQDKNGVNILITGEMAQATINEKARFLLWTGDLVGGSKGKEDFERELLTWRGLMEPLYSQGINVLPVRGNHETHCPEGVEVWNKVFSGIYALPQNGPASEKNLTFFYESGPVLVVGLDEYSTPKPAINQTWLDATLASHKKPFIFSAGHEAAFMDGHHTDVLDVNPPARDAFWTSLIKAGARTFFAGHDHLYDHMLITREGADPGPELHQFVAGTAGAPYYEPGPYTGVNTGWKISRVKAIGRTYGYLLVEVEDNKVTITFKGRTAPGVYVPMDSFSYLVPGA